MASVDLSVVIPCHDVEATLSDQLEALSEQQTALEWEVVVVDNRSTDDTRSIALAFTERFTNFKVVEASERAGISYARNVGVTASSGRFLLFCDGDDIVAPGWIEALAEGLDTNPIVTGRVELERLNPPWLAQSRGFGSSREGPPRFMGTFAYASGGNQGMHRDLYDRVGPFAEIVSGSEDMEYSLRCLMEGVEVEEAAEAVVHYRYRARPGELFRQGRTYGGCRPLIARMMIDAGRQRPPRFSGWRSWAWLVVHLPSLARRPGRANWLWVAGNRFGQLEGSIRYRVLLV